MASKTTNFTTASAVNAAQKKSSGNRKRSAQQQKPPRSLASLKPDDNQQPSSLLPIESAVATCQPPPVVDNPVGKLQELSHRHLWPLPFYSFECNNIDNPSLREFTCTVQLRDHSSRGSGRSKQLAKRSAAQAMLQMVADCPNSCCKTDAPGDATNRVDAPDNVCKPAPAVSPLDQATFKELQSSKRLQSAAKAGSEVGGLFRGVRNRKAGAVLPPLDEPEARDEVGASEQLLELSRQHRFGVQFLDEKTMASPASPDHADVKLQHRAVVKLSTMPTIVAVGSGVNTGAARDQACRVAMEYLCLLTRGESTPGRKA